MSEACDTALEVDLHRLELRFAETRLAEPRAVERLALSIERCGQLIPCIVVAVEATVESVGEPRWILIDGYRRWQALKRLGRDTARVQVWQCEIAQGLLQGLACASARGFAPIEEALVLRELLQGFGLSQHDLARQTGRDVSWVNRRLQLLSSLSEEALAAVRAGTLSCWAASRVLAPLARANAQHAEGLLAAVRSESLSTRELSLWFTHYQRAQRAVRERMVERPRLFLQALNAQQIEHGDEQLRTGPEGQCLQDLRHLNALIGRIRERLAALNTQEFSPSLCEALERLRARLHRWCMELERVEHDRPRDRDGGASTGRAEEKRARDRPSAEALA